MPTIAALAGTTVADGRAFVTVAFEWPQLWTLPSEKAEREALHLERLRADFRAERREEIYTGFRTGPDPPDFICDSGGREIGVECTQLVESDRLQQEAYFQRIRAEVLKANIASFRHLAGHIIYASFDRPAKAAVPAGNLAPALIGALQAFRPVADAYGGQLPEKVGPKHVHVFDGGRLVGVRLAVSSATPFFALTGYELALAFATITFADDLWSELIARVAAKDIPGTHELVISAGARTTGGQSYASDDFLARLAVARAEAEAIRTSNIERILLHAWSRRAIYEIKTNSPGIVLLSGEPAEKLG